MVFSDFPAGTIPPGQVQKGFDGAANRIISKNPGSRITNQRDLPLGTNPGREMAFDLAAKGGMRMRMYLVGNRLYGLTVTGQGQVAQSPDADRFLNSFKLQSGGGPVNPPPDVGPAIDAATLVRALQAGQGQQYIGQTITVRGNGSPRGGNRAHLVTGVVTTRQIPPKNKKLPPTMQQIPHDVDVHFRKASDALQANGPVTVRGVCQGFSGGNHVILGNAELVQPGGVNPPPINPPPINPPPINPPPAGAVLDAAAVVREFQMNEAAANAKYNGKVLTLRGPVAGRKGAQVAIETGLPSVWNQAKAGDTDVVVVSFRNPGDAAQANGVITVRGTCLGFDFKKDLQLVGAELVR